MSNDIKIEILKSTTIVGEFSQATFRKGNYFLSFRCDNNETVSDLEQMKFIVIYSEVGHPNHYRYVGVNNLLVYPPARPKPMNIYEVFEFMETSKVPNYCINRILDASRISTKGFIRSYMPAKRSPIGKSTREAVYAMYDGHCAYCGKKIAYEEMQVDHVDSHYRHQGEDDISNYLPSCRDCNGLKSDYLLEEFRNVLIPQCARANPNSNCRAGRICKAYKLKWNKNKIVFYFEKLTKSEK